MKLANFKVLYWTLNTKSCYYNLCLNDGHTRFWMANIWSHPDNGWTVNISLNINKIFNIKSLKRQRNQFTFVEETKEKAFIKLMKEINDCFNASPPKTRAMLQQRWN